jgi:RNA polymerase sporulation-specific sigma factor
MEHLVDRIALGQAVNRLQPLWQRIVILRYYRNLTQQETAEKLGLSQVKISREEKKIMEHLRRLLS